MYFEGLFRVCAKDLVIISREVWSALITINSMSNGIIIVLWSSFNKIIIEYLYLQEHMYYKQLSYHLFFKDVRTILKIPKSICTSWREQ